MWQVVGQNKLISLFERSLERGLLAHAYLLVGPAHVGKMTMALGLAQAVNCEAAKPPCGECLSCQKIASDKHADVQVISLIQNKEPEESKPRTEISIDDIRQMQRSASLPPFEGKHKVFIIDEADKMSIEAANALLKTLEEPVGKVLFILLTTNDKLLPATVISRCQRLELSPLNPEEAESALMSRWSVEPQRTKLLARLCHGCLGWAISAISEPSLLEQRAEKLERLLDIVKTDYEERFVYAAELAVQFSRSRESVLGVLDLWLDWWHDLLLIKTDCSGAVINVDYMAKLNEIAADYSLRQIRAVVGAIRSARIQLKLNANPQLVLDVLMLGISRKARLKKKVTSG